MQREAINAAGTPTAAVRTFPISSPLRHSIFRGCLRSSVPALDDAEDGREPATGSLICRLIPGGGDGEGADAEREDEGE